MKRRGRLYVEASKSVDKNKLYTPEEAVKLVKSLSKRKFDETVEVAMNLNVDTTKSDQQVRSSFTLPNGTGKTKRVLVVTKTKAEEAKNAGADFVGDDDIIEKIVKEKIDYFDVIQVEDMIFGIMNKELKAIVYLGALLGFILGWFNILISAL